MLQITLKKTLGQADSDAIVQHYEDTSSWAETAQELTKFTVFSNGNRHTADIFSASGCNVYYYEVHYIQDPNSALKCHHAIELPFIFQNIDSYYGDAATERDRAFSKVMSSYWSNFIINNNPNIGFDVPATWDKYTSGSTEAMILDETCSFDTMNDIEDMNFVSNLTY